MRDWGDDVDATDAGSQDAERNERNAYIDTDDDEYEEKGDLDVGPTLIIPQHSVLESSGMATTPRPPTTRQQP